MLKIPKYSNAHLQYIRDVESVVVKSFTLTELNYF